MPAPGSPDDEVLRGPRVVYGKLTTMTDERQAQDATPMDAPAEIRDIHEVPAVEVITTGSFGTIQADQAQANGTDQHQQLWRIGFTKAINIRFRQIRIRCCGRTI